MEEALDFAIAADEGVDGTAGSLFVEVLREGFEGAFAGFGFAFAIGLGVVGLLGGEGEWGVAVVFGIAACARDAV